MRVVVTAFAFITRHQPGETCGQKASDTDMYCSWDIPNSRYAVVVHDPTTTLSTAELIAVGESLTFDNLDQPDTWQPVS
jgi:hypothetical protein